MKEFQVGAGIPPGIILTFSKEGDVDDGTINNLLEQQKDKEMLTLIVQGLQKANDLQTDEFIGLKIQRTGYEDRLASVYHFRVLEGRLMG